VQTVYDGWRTGGRYWSDDDNVVDSLMMAYGSSDDDVTFSRQASVSILLFGYEFPNTILVFTENTLHVVTSPKKMKLLQVLGESKDGLHVKLYEKKKDGSEFPALLEAMKGSRTGARVGYSKSSVYGPSGNVKVKGKWINAWLAAVEKEAFTKVDVGIAVATVLGIQDAAAIDHTEKSGTFSTALMRKFVQAEIERIIDEEKDVKHSDLADQTEDVMAKPAKVGSKLDPDDLDMPYTPIVMSGGKYNLKANASSNDDNLHDGTIVVQLGARYRNYCSNLARTFFINASPRHQECYDLLTKVYQNCLSVMRPGRKMRDVYEAAITTVKEANAGLVAHFTADCGCGTGIEFRNPTMKLDANNKRSIKKDMLFNLCVGFNYLSVDGSHEEVLRNKTQNRKTFAVMLGDTIRVTDDEPLKLTNAKRTWAQISYQLGDENESSSDEEDNRSGNRRSTREGRGGDDASKAEAARNEHQRALELQKNEKRLMELSRQSVGAKFDEQKVVDDKMESFPDVATLNARSKNAVQTQVTVDPKAESILCPIGGTLVPFHIRTVKNVQKQPVDGDYQEMRITFHTSEGADAKNLVAFADHKAKYLRELTYRSSSATLDQVFFALNELRKRVKERQKQQEQKVSLVTQPDLIVNRTGSYGKLADVSLKPAVSNKKKQTGTLALHENGLRYMSTLSREKVDIIYANIKHCILQPASKTDLSVIIHFELKNPIVIGTKKGKKTNFLQVYVDVMEKDHSVDDYNSYEYDDGVAEENEARKNRQRWNERFRNFVRKAEEYTEKAPKVDNMEFDVPYNELAFKGVPNKSDTTLKPTVHSLVALSDDKPLCVTLREIEIVVFERVNMSQVKSFDLVIVFSDFTRPVQMIHAIQSNYAEPIKQWLDGVDILFFDNPGSYKWNAVLQKINTDVKGFMEDGGWGTILGDIEPEGEDGEEGDDDSDDESEFEPDSDASSDDEYQSESEGDDDDDDDDEFDGAGYGNKDSSEDEEDDWDKLEQKAKQQDKRKREELGEPRPEKAKRRKKK
jgi:nucleosome binding factor SPN SPT16 subunit